MILHLGVFTFLCMPACLHAIRVLDEVTEIDAHTAQNELVVAESLQSQDMSTAVVVKPHNYWTVKRASQRCKEARRGRWTRRIVGGVVGTLLALPVGLLMGLGTKALYWTWYLEGQSAVLFVSTAAVGALSAWSTIASWQGGVRVGQWTVDLTARLLGMDGHKPSCCCWDADTENPRCGIVGNKIGSKATCPSGAVHDAVACDMPEPEETFSGSTLGECKCKDVKTCSKNKFHRGHAWCVVKSGDHCKPQKRTWAFKHWDYCTIDAKVLEAGPVNQHLSEFVPNLDRGRFRLDAQHAWAFGSYVDTSKGLVIVRVKHENKDKRSSCFAGELEETLDGCAMKCIQEGTTFADEFKGTAGNRTMECEAFAYNRVKRLCVRLPKDATGAEFKPFQRNPQLEGGKPKDGWQNFRRSCKGLRCVKHS